MKTTKDTLTLKELEKHYKEANKIPQTDTFVVSPEIKKMFDDIWDRLSWYEKLAINISRLRRGYGLYKKR